MAWRHVLAAAFLAGPSAAWDRPDTFYFTGQGADVLIAAGTVRADGAKFACAGCHGANGRGEAEGATTIPPVTWDALTAPTGLRPAYDAESFALAVRSGIGPDGRLLSAGMPRYELDDAQLAGLIDSLKQLEAVDRRAFGPREIKIMAQAHDPRLRGFADAARVFNDAGGAYGRSIVIVKAGDALALEDVAGAALGALAETSETLLLGQIAADGHRRIRWQTLLSPAERDFRLRQRGLVHDDRARIVLWTSGDMDHPPLGTVDALYADLAVAAPALGAMIEQSVTVHLASPGASLLDAALGDPEPIAYVEGYLAGLALGQALSNAGRLAGQQALRRGLAEATIALPTSVHRIGD
jgi:hypothetical protein